MNNSPLSPTAETLRITALHSLNILDTPAEERFDRITRLASRIFGVPMALISLVDTNRQWFKSCVGMSERETPRNVSFCTYAIRQDETLVIPNATLDPRFKDNPLVTGEKHVRFYAGQPLKGPGGRNIGTLCLLDTTPRSFSETDRQNLQDLATWAELELNTGEVQRAAQKQAESEARQRALLDAMPDMMFRLSANGTYLDVKAAKDEDLLVSATELVGKTVVEVMPPPLVAPVMEAVGEVLKTGRLQTLEYGLPVGGQEQFYEARLVACGADEVTTIVRNVTERRKLEQLKTEFIAMVSHELRTPLTSILGSLGLVLGGVMGELPPGVATMLEIANKSSERLVRLIGDILDIEKLEAGKMQFEFATIRLVPLVQQVVEANQGFATKHGVGLVLETASSYPANLKVVVDIDRFNQLLTNLISNAIKFSPTGSRVTVRLVAGCEKVRIEVSDRGMGIPPEFKARIFQKFAQAGNSQSGGTGLGLSIAKAITERLGGTIGFESSVGEGTTFRVEFPVAGELAVLAF